MKTLVLALATWMSFGAAALADVPRVVADIPPVQSLVARVMGGLGKPVLVMRPGASPHSYAMRPSEAADLQRADVVFYVAPELTPWFERAAQTMAANARVVALLHGADVTRHRFRDTAVFEMQDGQDRHDDDHSDHDHSDHDHDKVDPHGWLDPENGKVWLSLIAETLAEQDPENAATYRANAAAGQREIASAAAEAKTTLAPVEDVNFIVFHDAYQYFERRFGLSVSGAIAMGDASSPGPRRIQELRDLLRQHDIACVFSEPQLNAHMIDTVVGNGGVRVAQLDPLGIQLDPGAGLYPALIRKMAVDIATCLGSGQ